MVDMKIMILSWCSTGTTSSKEQPYFYSIPFLPSSNTCRNEVKAVVVVVAKGATEVEDKDRKGSKSSRGEMFYLRLTLHIPNTV